MAVVVLGAIFIAAVFVVPSLSYVNLLYLEQQQMRNIALSALKTILFDEGYPANWGSMSGINQFNENDVKRFGLALLSDPSLFVLDPNKVGRLSASNPMGSMSYAKMKALMGLTGYDFSITLRPLFKVDRKVTITNNVNMATINFNINVSRNDGQPVPNAIVYATIVYTLTASSGPESFDTKSISMERKFTDSLGRCSGTQQITAPSGWEIKDIAVIFKVTVADRTTMVISEQDSPNPDDVAKINVVGDNIIATLNGTAPGSNDARWITTITMYNFQTSMNLYNHTSPPWGNPDLQKGSSETWTQNFPGFGSGEPSILIFTFRTVPQGSGRTYVLLVGPYTMWSQGGIIQFNPVPASSGASTSVQRDVIIAGMAYVAELRLWKT